MHLAWLGNAMLEWGSGVTGPPVLAAVAQWGWVECGLRRDPLPFIYVHSVTHPRKRRDNCRPEVAACRCAAAWCAPRHSHPRVRMALKAACTAGER